MKAVWVAVLEDGSVFVEGEGGQTWDGMPSAPRVRFLQIRDLTSGATLVTLQEFVRYYAYNEAVAVIGRQGIQSAKVIGGQRADGTVEEIRLEFRWSHQRPATPSVRNGALREGTG
jgi:hypothetical protein